MSEQIQSFEGSSIELNPELHIQYALAHLAVAETMLSIDASQNSERIKKLLEKASLQISSMVEVVPIEGSVSQGEIIDLEPVVRTIPDSNDQVKIEKEKDDTSEIRNLHISFLSTIYSDKQLDDFSDESIKTLLAYTLDTYRQLSIRRLSQEDKDRRASQIFDYVNGTPIDEISLSHNSSRHSIKQGIKKAADSITQRLSTEELDAIFMDAVIELPIEEEIVDVKIFQGYIEIDGKPYKIDEMEYPILEVLDKHQGPVSARLLTSEIYGEERAVFRQIENVEDVLFRLHKRGILSAQVKPNHEDPLHPKLEYEVNIDIEDTNKDKLKTVINGKEIVLDEYDLKIIDVFLESDQPLGTGDVSRTLSPDNIMESDDFTVLAATIRKFLYPSYIIHKVKNSESGAKYFIRNKEEIRSAISLSRAKSKPIN